MICIENNRLVHRVTAEDMREIAPWLNDGQVRAVFDYIAGERYVAEELSAPKLSTAAETLFPGSTSCECDHIVWVSMARSGIHRLWDYKTTEQLTAALRNQALPFEPGDNRDSRDWPEYLLIPEDVRTPKVRLQFVQLRGRPESDFYDLDIEVLGIPGLHQITAVLWLPAVDTGTAFAVGIDTKVLSTGRQQYRCVVSGINANGEPDLTFVRVNATEEEYSKQLHYEAAKKWATEQGYEPLMVADENDPGGRHLLDKFVWSSASAVEA